MKIRFFSKKKKEKMIKKSQRGFTLLELTFSVVLFTFIIGGVVLFGVRAIQAHQRSRVMQEALENARFTVEALNKTIRTSHTINADEPDFKKSDAIFIKDNATDKSYCYKFKGGKLLKKDVTTSTEVNSCSDVGTGFYEVVAFESDEGQVNGGFYVKYTDRFKDKRGFVRTVIELEYGDSDSPFEKSEVLFQSSVSLRDYGYNFN
ncbi:MAG: PilW family protein [Patescibacteria group bacterium]